MQTLPARAQLTRPVPTSRIPAVAGGIAAVLVAVLLFTRFGIHGALSRDESIYAYGGQQLANGVPPYASIFDPKAPLATVLCGLGATAGRFFGFTELSGIRALFFLLAVLAVLAIYLLALQLWESVTGAIVAAVVFASFYRFATDALGGPDAKTAAVLPIVLSMYFAARRQWFRAGLFGSVALLVWQPFVSFVLIALVLALARGDPEKPADRTEDADDVPFPAPARAPHWAAFGRTVLGAVVPVAVTVVYFVATGAWQKLVEAAVEFPATGVRPPHRSLTNQIAAIVSVVHGQFRFSEALVWTGTVLLFAFVVGSFVRHRDALRFALSDPVVSVVGLGWLLQAGYVLYDFEGGPDVFPLLPAPALCIGGVFAVLVRACVGTPRRVAACATLVVAAALALLAWVRFGVRTNGIDPVVQQADACALNRTVAGTGRLWVFGNPAPLVLTGRTNPDRFIYLGEGVDDWKIAHTPGGLEGWMAEVAAVHPSVVLIDDWGGENAYEAAHWLREHDYRRYFIGTWKVFLQPGIRLHALDRGVQITHRPTDYAMDVTGAMVSTHCRLPRVG